MATVKKKAKKTRRTPSSLNKRALSKQLTRLQKILAKEAKRHQRALIASQAVPEEADRHLEVLASINQGLVDIIDGLDFS